MTETLAATCPVCEHEGKVELLDMRRHLKRRPDLKLQCPNCDSQWWDMGTGSVKLIDAHEATPV